MTTNGVVPSSKNVLPLDVDDDRLYEGPVMEEFEEQQDRDRNGNINWLQCHVGEGAEDKNDGSMLIPLGPPPSSLSPSSSASSSLLPLPLPMAAVHFIPHTPKCGIAPHIYVAPREEAGIERTAVWGVNGSVNNLIWQPDTGEGCCMVLGMLSIMHHQ